MQGQGSDPQRVKTKPKVPDVGISVKGWRMVSCQKFQSLDELSREETDVLASNLIGEMQKRETKREIR